MGRRFSGSTRTRQRRAADEQQARKNQGAQAGNNEEFDEKKPAEHEIFGKEKSRQCRRLSAQEEITKKFQADVDRILSGTYKGKGALLLGDTPKIMEKLGIPSLPVVIGEGHVYSIAKTKAQAYKEKTRYKMANYHGLGETVVKNLYQYLNDPVMVIASKDVGNQFPVRSMHSVVAIIDIGQNNQNMLMPVEITVERNVNGKRIDVNVLSSAYLKNTNSLIENALAEENAGQIGIFYSDTKNEAVAKVAERVQFPNQPTKAAASSEIILHQVSEKVNLRVENQTQTKQFMQWFGDWQNSPSDASRIVNSDGTPKVMYHQTDADFSVFRTESTGAGRGDAILPDGAFFKSSDTDIGVSGQKQMQVYLNVRNPLRLKDRASAQAYWEKHVVGYKELMQEAQRVDALYNMRMERAEAEEDARYAELWQQWKNGEISEEQYQSGIKEDVSEKILQEWKQEEQRITQQAKQLLNDYMHNSKYDGIILAKDEGSFSRSTDSVIAFSPNQVKSATDNVGTFDRGNADIRYSVKPRSAESYESEIERLKKQRDEAKRQIKLSRYQEVTPDGIERMAQKLLKEYHSTANADELTDTLQTLYNILHKRPELIDTDGAYSFAESAAELILDDFIGTKKKPLRCYGEQGSQCPRRPYKYIVAM